MASKKKSRKISLLLSSTSPKLPPTPSQPPCPPPMKFPITHRSNSLDPKLKLVYDEVFSQLSQSPHFNPLESFKSETIREGLKLGYDVAFLLLFQKLYNLDDPFTFLSEVDSLTREFKEFEEMGYDLTEIKQRFNLLRRSAEKEKGLKNGVEVLEMERQQEEEKVLENEFLLVELANESAKVAKKVKKGKSVIQSIDNQKRKMIADSKMNVSEFKKLARKRYGNTI